MHYIFRLLISSFVLVCFGFFINVDAKKPTHDFHSSLTVLEYEPQSSSYEITIKVFTDDLEAAISKEAGKTLKIDSPTAKAYLQKYLYKNFACKQPNSNIINWEFIDVAVNHETTEIFLEYISRNPKAGLDVKNSLLTDIFDDQQNITTLKFQGQSKSFLFSKAETKYYFSF